VGVRFLVSLKFNVLNNVENESLQTSVCVCLTCEAYQLLKGCIYIYTYRYVLCNV